MAYYKDVVFYKGNFYTDKKNITQASLHNRFNEPYSLYDIDELKLSSLNDIECYDKGIIFVHGFDSNMAHLLWDVIYPSWYGLFYYSEEYHNIDFQYMSTTHMYEKYGDKWHKDVVEKFSGNKLTTPKLIQDIYINKPLKIPWLIVGCKQVGIGNVDTNFCAKRELKDHLNDPIECFVNRIYFRYNIQRNTFINKPPHEEFPINIIYIKNKRPYNKIDILFDELQKENLNNYTFKIIDWSHYNFETQLNILNSTRIIICGVGTARGNTPFLPKGSIEIQTNTHSLNLPNNINYFDYHIGTLSKYVKVLNINKYSLIEAKNNLYSQDLKSYINNAINNFSNTIFPVKLEDNRPLDVIKLNNYIKNNKNIFIRWRNSGSNDVGDLMKEVILL